VAHLEREFMLADELMTSRPGVLLRMLVSSNKSLVRLPELRPVVVEHYQLTSSKEYPTEEVPRGDTELELPPEIEKLEVVIAQEDGTTALYNNPRIKFELDKFSIRASAMLMQCHKPLAIDICCGSKSATGPMERFFRTVTMDWDPKWNPTFCANLLDWDYKERLNQLRQKGYGVPRFAFVATPCNAWSLMRYLPGRPPIMGAELEQAKELARKAAQILEHMDILVRQEYGPSSGLPT